MAFNRRDFMALSTAALIATQAPHAFSQPSCDLRDGVRRPKYRLALLIGNSTYPKDDNLPSAKKNVADLAKLLRDGFSFDVTAGLDLDQAGMQQALKTFSRQVGSLVNDPNVEEGDVASIVYFCGHGLQRTGTNLLIPARIDQTDPKIDQKAISLQRDVLSQLPSKSNAYPGLNLVLIDACRAGGDVKETFAQFASVQGCLATISSSAGGFAFFPDSADQNSYFTQALIEVLEDERRNPRRSTSIEEVMVLVEKRTEAISKEFFFDDENASRAKRGLPPWPPQLPESTKNLRNPAFVMNTSVVACAAMQRERSAEERQALSNERDRYAKIQAETSPRRIRNLCDSFLKDFPNSDFLSSVKAKKFGAEKTIEAVKGTGVATDTLVIPDSAGDELYRQDLLKASALGDKDASQRVAWMYRDGSNGLPKNFLRYQDFLKLSSQLGNAFASYELYEILRRSGNPETRGYLERAKKLGYPVPKDLPEDR